MAGPSCMPGMQGLVDPLTRHAWPEFDPPRRWQDVEATARTLAAAAGTATAGEDAAAHAYLFDDNAELRGNARVVQVG
jgi:hypothetical protein